MTVVERIKEVAKKRGYNLKTTALKAGLGENVIYGWQKYAPSSDKLKAVADVLHVSVDYLLGTTDDPNPRKTGNGPREVDLKEAMQDDDTMLAWDGRPIPDEEKEMIRRILDGGNK